MNNNDLFGYKDREELLDLIGKLLTYPTMSFFEDLNLLKQLINNSNLNLDNSFDMFCSLLNTTSLGNVQEFYSETFELKPKCTMNVGVQIFDEDTLKRSMLMTRLREAYKEFGVEEKTELPDFLPFVLRLSAKITDVERLKSLMEECLVAPVKGMINQFGESQNPYSYLLKTVYQIVSHDTETLNSIVLEDAIC